MCCESAGVTAIILVSPEKKFKRYIKYGNFNTHHETASLVISNKPAEIQEMPFAVQSFLF